jgi:hypothetical protein
VSGDRGSHKTESVSALDEIIGEDLRMQVFLTYLLRPPNGRNRPSERLAPMLSGIARVFWRWPRRLSLDPAQMPFCMT